MSYCEIIAFREHVPSVGLELRNAWGGAAYVWNHMYDKFLKDPANEYDSWLRGAGTDESPLWKLHKRQDIPMFMRAVHTAMYDHAIVSQANFSRFVADLREFDRNFAKNGSVCHLESFAKFIEENADAEAIGFYGTSVSEYPWHVLPQPEGDDDDFLEPIPYSLETGDKHFEVYEELEGESR